ncbi:AMP-binding protein [Flagellimonas okinawensis]|uniref:AMP-binding protein n=1 Tax=Flagellimonas okinawensis TaxID=3031324 RepID=A0ABT5XRK8_9FLAO|nr:AMP-binding protein [[Muricauda] okinawensis]MDF0708440.1 AMP-binding protein [[Muricauda] okinawensis]
MEHQTWHRIHPEFRLNGIPCAFENLFEVGYSFVKEGEEFEDPIGDFLLDWGSQKSTLQVSTSGSTGKPKTITLLKEQMVNSALATGEYFNLKPKQKALLCLPCTGIAGKMMLVRAMVLGLHLDYVEPSSSPMPNNDKIYDFVAMVPLQVQNSLHQLSRVQQLIVGGAPVDANLRKRLVDLPVQAFETYGMTETITHIAVKRIDEEALNPFETLPNVRVSQDDRGCLVIDAPKISDGKIITNDLVELINDNKFYWLGRYDSIINSGGVKLVPEKIEEKLSEVLGKRFFVAGQPDEALGHRLILVVEGEPSDPQKIIQNIKGIQNIAKFEIPKQVYFVKSFVETSTKKVDRKKTMELIG